MSDTRDKILLAAVEAMAINPKASMQDVANTAGVSKAALYYFFKNKEDLLISLVKQEMSHMMYEWEQVNEQQELNAFEKLKHIMNIWLQRLHGKRAVGQFIIQQFLNDNTNLQEMMMSAREKKLHLLTDIVTEGNNAKLWKVKDTGATALLIMNIMDLFAIEMTLMSHCVGGDEVEKMHQTVAQALLELLQPNI